MQNAETKTKKEKIKFVKLLSGQKLKQKRLLSCLKKKN